MQKLLAALILTICVSSGYAQTDKGDWLTGGAVYFSTSSSEGITLSDTFITSSVNFNVSAFGGYFVVDNLCVGLGFGYGRNAATNNYAPIELTDISTSLSVEAIARYYYWNGDHIKLWTGLGVRKGFGKYDDHFYDYDDQGNGNGKEANQVDDIATFSIGFGPGASIMLNPKLALEVYFGSIGYSGYTLKREGGSYDYTPNSCGISLANTFGFGITYHFIKD